MKKLLFATFCVLLLAGCGEKPEGDSSESNQSAAETPQLKSPEIAKIDLEDNETRNRIIAEAIDHEKLKWSNNENDLVLLYTPNLWEGETVSFSEV